MNIPRLCLIKSPWAFFTTQAISEQWGEDWHRCPEYAGEPYTFYDYTVGKKPCEISRIAFLSNLRTAEDLYSRLSVEKINNGIAPWLFGIKIAIYAGTPKDDFIRIILENGGKIFQEVKI